VVLGNPIAVVAEAVCEAGEVDGIAKGVARGRSFGNGRLIENAEAKIRHCCFGCAGRKSDSLIEGGRIAPGGTWYLRYPLSYQHLTKLVAETGCWRGRQLHLAPGAGLCTGVEQTLPPDLKPTNKSYRID
jgi:hypothetical protein